LAEVVIFKLGVSKLLRNRYQISIFSQYLTHENYDPLKDSEDPDDWLRNKLHTLRQRRHNDPAVARRQVERDLLEDKLLIVIIF
jgi:hypothetical protein